MSKISPGTVLASLYASMALGAGALIGPDYVRDNVKQEASECYTALQNVVNAQVLFNDASSNSAASYTIEDYSQRLENAEEHSNDVCSYSWDYPYKLNNDNTAIVPNLDYFD